MPNAYTVFESVKGQRVAVECPPYVDDNALGLTENAIKVLEKRYVRRDVDGKAMETPAGMFYRVAAHVAQGDEAQTKEFYDLLTEKRFYPNSPTFTGAATPLGQLAACFVLPLSDDMGGESDGIFSTLRNAALVQQTGGGNGFSFGRLRPKGDPVHTSNGIATGPVGFMKVYDAAFGEIAQGGCFVGSTLVATSEGPKRISDIQEGDTLYSWHHVDGYVLRKSSAAWKTKENAEVWKLVTDKGLVVYATPDHRFMTLPDHQYVEMKDLKVGVPLLPLTRYIKDGEWFISLRDGTDARIAEHVWLANQSGVFGEHIHHKDGNHLNNILSNLEGLTATDHTSLHNKALMSAGEHPFQRLTSEQRERSRSGYAMWFDSLSSEQKSAYQSKRAQAMNKKLLEKGAHNFQVNPPMRNPEALSAATKSRIARALWKVMSQGLPVDKDTWPNSSRVLYNSQRYSVTFIESKFGSFDAALSYCNERNHRVVSVEFSHYEDVYDVEVEDTHNFVVCNEDRRGVVVHNSRRGANMGVLPVWHPDVEAFIECKSKEGDIANFNISVAITDEFMRQVKVDGEFNLINPRTKKPVKTIKAKALFNKIVKYAHKNGEPGALFIDAANRSNPVPHLYELESTNP